MKLISLFLFLILAFNSHAAKITDDTLKVGEPGSSADKVIKLGDTRLIRSNETTGNLEFTNDGTLYKKIGSGTGAGGDGGVNILLNNSFEDGLGNWTNSGGTLTQETYTKSIEGNTKYARFVATAAGQYVESDCTDKPDNLSGGGMADIRYLGGSGNFELKVFDCTSGDVEISTGSLADISEWLKSPTQTYSLKSKMKLRIISTAAGTIDFDESYLGSNKGFIAGTYINSIKLEGSDGRAITALTEDVFYSGTGEGWTSSGDDNYYTVQSANSIIKIKTSVQFTSAASDAYIYLYKNGIQYKALNRQVGSASLRFGSYISSKGEFNIGDQLSLRIDFSTSLQNTPLTHYLNIVEQSGETQEAYTPEQANFFVESRVHATDNSDISLANVGSTPTETTSGTLINVNIKGSSNIPCSGTNPSTGTTCSVGNESLGINFNAPVSGVYELCSNIAHDSNSGTIAFRWVHTQNSSQTVIATGEGISTNVTGTGQYSTSMMCSYFNVNNVGEQTFRIFYTSNVAGASIKSNNNALSYNQNIHITARLVSHNVSRPIIQNMVDTSVKSGVRTDSCEINNPVGAPTLNNDNGLCGWVNSVSQGSTSTTFILEYSGFSSRPNCGCSNDDIGGTATVCNEYSADTNHSLNRIAFRTFSSTTNGDQASNVRIFCKGAR